MTIKELDRKIDDSKLQVCKYIFLDIVFALGILMFHYIQAIIIFFPLLICTMITTYDWIDYIGFMKIRKKELEEE